MPLRRLNDVLVSALLCALALPALSNPQLSTGPLEISLHFFMPLGSVPLDGGRAEDRGDELVIFYDLELPNDCRKLAQLTDAPGVGMDGVTLNQVSGAWKFCSRVGMLYRGAPSANIDFVSDLDFTDLPLTMVPHDMSCVGETARYGDFCDAVGRRDPKVCRDGLTPPEHSFATFVELEWKLEERFMLDCRDYPVDTETCHLTDGLFMGRASMIGNEIVCLDDKDDSSRSGVELYDVHFRDMNHDGFMDAILSFVERQPGSRPDSRTTIVLTQKTPIGPLERIPGY